MEHSPKPMELKRAAPRLRADDTHVSTGRPNLPAAVSGHGYWIVVPPGCPSGTTARVEVILQYLDANGDWVDREGPDTHKINPNQLAGGGKGKWTAVHSYCVNNGPRTWRILVDIDLNGFADPPDIGVSKEQEWPCS